MASNAIRQRNSDVTRWDPFEDIEQLQQQLAQVFPAWSRMAPVWSRAATAMDTEFVPLADVEETDDAFIVELELPGVDKGDALVEMSGRRLTVTGERKERERKGTLRRRARVVGRFRYEILLPSDVDDKKVEATLKDGELTIRIPKLAEERPKKINITS